MVIEQMLQIPPNRYLTLNKTYSHTTYKRLRLQITSCYQVSSGQSDLYEFKNFRKKLGFQSFQDFKSSETRGTGNSGLRWLNEEKCFPPQVPGQNYKKKTLVVPQSQERD